jgi:ribonucleotide monophosphatase NagD (HAD superfamily)
MIGDNYDADVLGAKSVGFDAIMVLKENTMNYEKYAETLDGIWEFL